MDDTTTRAEQRRQLVIEPTWVPDPTIAHWLGAMQDARSRTLRLLEGIDQRALDWQRGEENSVGTMLYHVAAIEADWLYAEVLTEPFPDDVVALLSWEVRDGEGRLTEVPGRGLSEHLALLEAIRQRLVAAFETMTLEDFQRPRALPNYDVTPEWVLHHLMQHEAEHRGQIEMLLTTFQSAG